MKTQNPVTVDRDRASKNIKGLAGLDIQKPIEIHNEIQSEILAVRSVMRRFRVSSWHAKTICQLSGLGGQAA